MVFSDLFFIFVFLVLCFTCYFAIPKLWAKNAVLIVFSLAFYAWGEPTCIFLLIASALVNYLAGLVINAKRGRAGSKIALFVALAFNIGLLFVFKYTDFFVENFNAIFNTAIREPHIRMPIGISFFTFQIMSYVIDCYWEKVDVQKNFFKLLLYISLFPQLVAGPIVRYATIEEEISNRKSTLKDVSEGLTRFVVGLTKKVIFANGLYVVVTELLGDYKALEHLPKDVVASQSYFGVVVGVICYALYIYFDFSGYSDMAIGIGRVFGFHFDENFKYPFVSKTISEFWQRWHISLGSFFRDYLLYVPIFGKRRKYVSLFLVWFCTGFWHGASWNFIIWGLYFGVFILIEMLIGKKRMKKIPVVISHVYSLIVIAIGFAIFFFEDLSDLGLFFTKILHFDLFKDAIVSFSKFNIGNFATVFVNYFKTLVDPMSKATVINNVFLIVASVVISMPILPKIKKFFYTSKEKEAVAVCITSVTNVVLLLLCIIMLTDSNNNPFLYFRF